MAVTRGTTGNSKPRTLATVSTEPGRKRASTKTRKAPMASAPRATDDGVAKRKKADPKTTAHKREPTITDKLAGAVEKVVGKIEGKPGKVRAGTRRMRGTDGRGSHKIKKTAD